MLDIPSSELTSLSSILNPARAFSRIESMSWLLVDPPERKNRVSVSQVLLQVVVQCPAQQVAAAASQLRLECADQAAGQSVIGADQAPGQQRCEGGPQLRVQLVVLVGTAQAPVLLSAAAA
jgi:hypothetical protein